MQCDSSPGAAARHRGRCPAGVPGVLLLWRATLPAPVMAARPFVVDDARIVDRGGCQVESWVKRNPGSHELWALPACNPFGAEITAGVGALDHDATGSTDERDQQLQVKGLFRELRRNDFGWGLAAGMVRRADINTNQNLLASTYFYLPLSVSFHEDRFVLLTNVGGVDNRDRGRRGLSWGVGGEYYASDRIVLLVEAYGATGMDRYAQAALRYWVLSNRLQLDGSYGFQPNGGNRAEWFTLGFRWITPVFF